LRKTDELDLLDRRLLDDGRFLRVLEGDVFHEGEQPLEVLLLVVLDVQVVVALGALQIDAEEQPPHVARQGGVIDGVLAVVLQPLGIEEGRAARPLVLRPAGQDVAGHLVPRLVLLERRPQVGAPGGVVAQPLHQHDVEQVLHPSGVVRTLQELVDQLCAFVGRLVGEEGAGLRRRGNAAREVEAGAAEELGVVGARPGGPAAGLRHDECVDARVQGVVGSRAGRQQGDQQERGFPGGVGHAGPLQKARPRWG